MPWVQLDLEIEIWREECLKRLEEVLK